MQADILKKSNILKILFIYTDGKKIERKEKVTIKLLDKKSCYFEGLTIANYSKPRWRARVKLMVYTTEGIYYTEEIIRDVTFTFQNLIYKIDLPKEWKYKQLRASSRQNIELPVKIIFNDDFELETSTYDISIGGFSFKTNEDLTSVQKSFQAECFIDFTKTDFSEFPENKFSSPLKYVRTKILETGFMDDFKYCHVFKFYNISPQNKLIYRNYFSKFE